MESKIMESKMSPSIPASRPACPRNQKIVSELIPYCNQNTWTLVSVSASSIEDETSQWHQEQSNGTIYVVGKYNDNDYEVIIDPVYLQRLQDQHLQFNLEYNPTKPERRQIDVYGKCGATKKAHAMWLPHAAYTIYSERHPEVATAYYHIAESNGIDEALQREKLIYDISTCILSVRRRLAQHLVILVLSFGSDYDIDLFLQRNDDDLLDDFQGSLRRKEHANAQLTSLIRALLELSGGTVDQRQHRFDTQYTVNENADLYASILDITREREFGASNSAEDNNALSRSPVFSAMTVDVSWLQACRMKMMKFLHIGFPKEHLHLPSQVLCGFGIGTLSKFHAHIEYTYLKIPLLRKPENNIRLLIIWSTMLEESKEDFERELEVLRKWADSEDGQNLYNRWARDVQGSRSVEQLTVDTAALTTYRQLRPDFEDDRDQPITGSYLADLNALFHGHRLGNSGKVTERMAFALLRVLRCEYDDLAIFLETALNREPSPSDDLAHQYLTYRAEGQAHETAFETTTKAPADRDHISDDDKNWCHISHGSQNPYDDSTSDWEHISHGSPSPYDDSTSDWEHISHRSPSPYNNSTSPATEIRTLSQQPQCGAPYSIINEQRMNSKPTMASMGVELHESFRQEVGHSLWKAMPGLIGPVDDEIPKGIFLDIATGTGDWVKEAAAAFPGREIWGVDIRAYDWPHVPSRSCYRTGTLTCNYKSTKNLNFLVRDCELDLPFKESSTAFVNLRDTDLWIRDKNSLFDRIAVVLQPSGLLQHREIRLSQWNCTKSEVNRWREHVLTCARTLGCEMSSSIDVRKSLEERGFEVYKMSQCTWQISPRNELNDRVRLFWKLTIGASRRILIDGGFGTPQAVDELLRTAMLKLDEPDCKAIILAHSCLVRRQTRQ